MTKDLVGQRFGRLVVLREAGYKDYACGSRHRLWLCQCDCGATVTTLGLLLKKGKSRSCGCLKLDSIRELADKHRRKIFWEYVQKAGHDDCWLWAGALGPLSNGSQYGRSGFGGKYRYAHKAAYLLSKGDVPNGMFVLHSCHNKLCCNPNHLRIGTHKDNMDDLVASGARKGKCAGEANGRSMLSQTQADEIRAIYARGNMTQEEIGNLFDVSQFAISMIVRNKRYVTATPPQPIQPEQARAETRAKQAAAAKQLPLL